MFDDCQDKLTRYRSNGAIKEEVCGNDYVKYRKYTLGRESPKIKEQFTGSVITTYRKNGTIKTIGEKKK